MTLPLMRQTTTELTLWLPGTSVDSSPRWVEHVGHDRLWASSSAWASPESGWAISGSGRDDSDARLDAEADVEEESWIGGRWNDEEEKSMSSDDGSGRAGGGDGGAQWGSLRADRPAASEVESRGEGGRE